MMKNILGAFFALFFCVHTHAFGLSFIIFGDHLEDKASPPSSVFEQFFQSIKPIHPNALFYLGDVIKGDEAEDFDGRIERIAKVLKNELGFKVPFYPLIPSQLIKTNDLTHFIEFFGLKASVLQDEIVYTVEINQNLFVILARHHFSPTLLLWLEDILSRKKSFKNVFVFGKDQIFSSSDPFLQKEVIPERENFWNLLSRYKVKAYFCNGSKIYDRKLREGVWQINLGGYLTNEEKSLIPFNQFFLLKVNEEATSFPSLTLIDNQGKQKDFIEFNEKNPIYQFRVSSFE